MARQTEPAIKRIEACERGYRCDVAFGDSMFRGMCLHDIDRARQVLDPAAGEQLLPPACQLFGQDVEGLCVALRQGSDAAQPVSVSDRPPESLVDRHDPVLWLLECVGVSHQGGRNVSSSRRCLAFRQLARDRFYLLAPTSP